MKTCSPQKTFLFTALPCEAKPLIDAYKLKKDIAHNAFSIFKNDGIALTVTGIGKTAMAAGVAYSRAVFSGQPYPAMLNIGIAGHKQHAIGSLFLADKLIENDTGKCFYPPLASFTPPCATETVMTFAKPQEAYPESALCDMEASSFYEAATRFSTSELCQCVKIISDNAGFPAQHIQAHNVNKLIQDKLEVIDGVLSALKSIAQLIPEAYDKTLYTLTLERFRFSANEQIQLDKLLTKFQAMGQQHEIESTLRLTSNAKEFLMVLNQTLNNQEFTL